MIVDSGEKIYEPKVGVSVSTLPFASPEIV